MSNGIYIDTDDAEKFLATYENATDVLHDEIVKIIADFNALCGDWNDRQRKEFEEELISFASDIDRMIENTQEDKNFLRRLIEKANVVSQTRFRRI